MTFNEVEPAGAQDIANFGQTELRPTRLRLISQAPFEAGTSTAEDLAQTRGVDPLALVVAGQSTAATALDPTLDDLEALVGTPAAGSGMLDLDLASPALADDAHTYAELKPVSELLRREQAYRRLLAAADALGALGAVAITSLLWHASASWVYLVAPLFAIAVGKVQGLYDRDDMVIRKSTVTEWRQVLRAAGLTGVANYLIWRTATTAVVDHSLRALATLTIGTFALMLPARAIARRLARHWTVDERCLVVGTPEQCADLASQLESVAGVDLIGTISNADVDCSVAGVQELAERLNVHRIVVGPHPAWREQATLKLIRSAKWLGVRVSLMPTIMTVVGTTTAVDELDSLVLLGIPRFGLSRSSELLKRSLDLLGASIALLLTWPLMLGVALAVKLDSPGRSLFRQKRIGRNGQAFTMFKFRSMVDGADHMRPQLHTLNQSHGLFKIADDPRVTKVGKLIRRTYLDELPQLLNVLRGEMSLVGPRPLIESEDALLTGYDRHRSRLTPGITGPWQLRGPLNASLPELAKLDYMYASNWSIWTDVDIIFGTVVRIISRHGR